MKYLALAAFIVAAVVWSTLIPAAPSLAILIVLAALTMGVLIWEVQRPTMRATVVGLALSLLLFETAFVAIWAFDAQAIPSFLSARTLSTVTYAVFFVLTLRAVQTWWNWALAPLKELTVQLTPTTPTPTSGDVSVFKRARASAQPEHSFSDNTVIDLTEPSHSGDFSTDYRLHEGGYYLPNSREDAELAR